jgi:ribosome-associated toxin RatA of RatAB toxin-antitoxin module
MSTINRSALLPFSAQQIYNLINDVESYPQFLDGCVAVEVFHRDEQSMQARLDLAKAGLHFSFITRNTLTPPVKVELALVDGPFTDFHGEWTLSPLSEQACKVSLSLQFTLAGKVLGLAAKTLFNPLANNLVDSLVKRAYQLYK